ncbi:MAG: hypothetical protein PQJ46_11965, partial [Spirochaetales bacterium]|nr:hypothetical protein [Spirochaetales bacterium]
LLGFNLHGGIEQFIELVSLFEKLSVINILYSLVIKCLLPLYSVMSVVIYVNLLKDKEGFETEQLANSFLEEK